MKTQLIFDYESSKALQYYLYAKGEITPAEKIDNSRIVNFFGYNHRYVRLADLGERALQQINCSYGIDTMLLSLCMFDEIKISPCNGDAYMDFEGKKLDGEGKFQDIGISYVSKYKKPNEQLISNTIDVFKAHRSNIINAINRDDCFMHLRYVAEECETFEMYIDNKMYIDALDRYRKRPVKNLLDRINPLPSITGFERMRDFWDPERYTYETYLDECFLHIYDVLSTNKGYALSNCFSFSAQRDTEHLNEDKENHDKINYMASINFNKKIMLMPQPQTLKEVEELRKDPDWISFRKVYAQWITYLQDGDLNAFAKMRADVISAQQALEKINKYKKVEGNVLTRLLFLLGGEIPIVAEVLSGYGFVSAMKVDDIERENRWCNLPVFVKNMDRYVK